MASVKVPFRTSRAVQRTVECCLVFKRVPMFRERRVQVSRLNEQLTSHKQERTQTYLAISPFISRVRVVEELTCLAAWKDGNARYLVGLVSHNHATSNEERFRCFVYEKINSNSGKYGTNRFSFPVFLLFFFLIQTFSHRPKLHVCHEKEKKIRKKILFLMYILCSKKFI